MDRTTNYGNANAATEETVMGLIYGTWEVSIDVTSSSCGLFAQISRLLTEGGWLPEKASALRTRAELAWQYLERNIDINDIRSHRYCFTYAALQMYLLTGEEKYHNIFKTAAEHCFINPDTAAAKYPDCWGGGNTYTHATTCHFISYLLPQKYPIDETTAQGLKDIIFASVNLGGYMKFFPENESYPSGCIQSIGWGAGVTQGVYADIYVFAYLLTDDAEKKQQYFDIISQFSDYALGLNPLGMSFVTGLGYVQPVSPLHDDSYYTKYGLSDGVTSEHVGKPKGNVPGLLIFGTTGSYPQKKHYLQVISKLHPAWEQLPYYRHWSDGWTLVANNEVGTDKTLWNALMYAFLYNASQDPNVGGVDSRNNGQKDAILPAKFSLHQNYPNPFNSSSRIVFELPLQSNVVLKVFDVSGRQIKTLIDEVRPAGIHVVEWNDTSDAGQQVASGVYFYQIESGSGLVETKKMIVIK